MTVTNMETIWVGIGFLGQALFAARFLLQWVHSERQQRSVIPIGFWYFSAFGGLTLLAYAIYRGDPVFIAGQATGIFVYARNLYFIHRRPDAAEPA